MANIEFLMIQIRDKMTIFGESAAPQYICNLILLDCTALQKEPSGTRELFDLLNSIDIIRQAGFTEPYLKYLLKYHMSLGLPHTTRRDIDAVKKEQLLDSLKRADVKDIVPAAFTMMEMELPLRVTVSFAPTMDTIPSDPSPETVFLDASVQVSVPWIELTIQRGGYIKFWKCQHSIRKVFAKEGNMQYTFCWVVAALLAEVHCQRFTEVVTTDKGAVRGSILRTAWKSTPYSAFMGIPFAKPPVGDLRFKDPIEADPWTGVRNATEDSAVCVQDIPVTPSGNEDCLYLNVFTPLLNFTKIERLLPVMIWIYGGAFAEGSASRETYGPDFFLENNVVFVDMNYRLGPLGFLALGLDGARGNQALKDQNMAMRWVQKNIANFGGDPNKVTIFGESAGAVSVMYHLMSPKSEGLFQQAIAQSGSPICPWAFHTPEQAALAAYDLGARMGIVAETKEHLLDALKKADIKDMIKSLHGEIIERILLPITLPFNPTIDVIPSDPSPEKVFLDDCPISKLQSGDFQHVPMIYGYNKDEGILLTLDPDLLRNQTIERLNKLFAFDVTGLSRGLTSLLNTVATGTLSELTKVATAFYFSGPIDSTQRMLAKYNGKIPVYYYRLSYSTNHSGHKQFDSQINGTSHGDDLTLLFADGSGPPLDPNSEYNMYRKKLVSLWTNFAKYGNPTPQGQPINGAVWLASGEEGRQIDMGNEAFTMHGRLLEPIAHQLSSLYTSILPHISACVPKPWNPFGIL